MLDFVSTRAHLVVTARQPAEIRIFGNEHRDSIVCGDDSGRIVGYSEVVAENAVIRPAGACAQAAMSQELYEISIPAIEADIRFAMVPASIARKPSRASSPRLFGASAPMPPI